MPSFFFNDTATTEIYTLSLHDALPIYFPPGGGVVPVERRRGGARADPDRHLPVGEAGGDAAADFAGAAEHEYERLLLHVLCHAPSQKDGRRAGRGRGEISVVGVSIKKK